MSTIITRRDFMRGTAGLALGATVGFAPQASKQARVVLIRRQDLWNGEELKPDLIQPMLDEAIVALLGTDDPVKAFRRLVRPEDIVGIKANAWRFLPTPPALIAAIERRVMDAGVSKNNLSVDDRGVRNNPTFQKATALINARPARTHFWSGIGGCIKNYVPFSANPPDYHPDSCADLALLWKLPAVEGKTRLNILSMLNPLFHGRGPHHFDRRFVWNYNGLIVGTDPVAVDAVGLQIIQAKRREHFGGERELQTSPKHIQMADVRHGLGTSDLQKIDLVKLGWQEGILI